MVSILCPGKSKTMYTHFHNSDKQNWIFIKLCINNVTSVLFFSRPRFEGWPHYGRAFFYLCPLSFWLTLPRKVLSTSWYCPSKPCVVFLACVHQALSLALSLSPGISLVSSWCDHSMLTSLLWQCLTVSFLLQLWKKLSTQWQIALYDKRVMCHCGPAWLTRKFNLRASQPCPLSSRSNSMLST